MCHILFIQSPVDECLSWFQLGAIMSEAVVNIYVQDFVWSMFLFLMGEIAMGGIVRAHGKCRLTFTRNCQTLLQSDCTIL